MTDTVIVIGATGVIGREITARLLESDVRVVAIARNVGRLKALARPVNSRGQLVLLPGSVANEFDAGLLVNAVRGQQRRVTAVVSCLRGPVESGRLLSRSAPSLLNTLAADVVTPFIAAKHFISLLAESASEGREGLYLLLGGPMAACAWSGYGQVSVAAAALQMLTHVIREEVRDSPVTVQELQIGTPVRAADDTEGGCPDWIAAEEVARHVVALIGRRDRTVPVVQIAAHGSGQEAGARIALHSRSPS